MTRTPAAVLAASHPGPAGCSWTASCSWPPGQIAPITTGPGRSPTRTPPTRPTLVELAIIAGAGAFMAFVYTLAERYLDMGEADVHVFFGWPWVRAPRARRRPRAHEADPEVPGHRRDRGRHRGTCRVVIATVSRYAFRIAVAALTVGILVVGSVPRRSSPLPDVGRRPRREPDPGADRHGPQPTPRSGMALSPVGIEMPGDADCDGCHITGTGTVGTKPIPVHGSPAGGLARLHRVPRHGQPRQDRPRPLEPPQGRLPDLPPDARPRPARATARPDAPGAHGRRQALCTSCHGIDEHAPLPEEHGRPRQLLDLPQRARSSRTCSRIPVARAHLRRRSAARSAPRPLRRRHPRCHPAAQPRA